MASAGARAGARAHADNGVTAGAATRAPGETGLQLPTFKGRPGWEFTDISGLDLPAYERELAAPLTSAPATLFELETDGLRQDGVLVCPLERAPADLVERHLGSLLAQRDDPFVAICEAGPRTGTLVHVGRGVRVERPISIGAVQARDRTLVNQRTLIVLEEGAEADVWDQLLSADAQLDGVLNVVTELVVGAGARLRYVCGQGLSERSWIFGAQRADVARDGSLEWVALGFGSVNGHVRMQTRLAGPGSEARVTGAYAARGGQHIDFDTTQEHAAPSTTSDLAFRGVLADRSTAVWKGNIIVDPGAQRTDAFQESRNLLISKRAHADAIPGLEIQANDVRCTHAAAVAQIDPDQLFYLRSHGLLERDARRLVIEGFLEALVERFPEGEVRRLLAGAIERRLALVLGA
ncbi:MAG TPA: Fe-S cluster assembly protein SufD [Solirubrobacteraceae bacterium]|nr:Fe-S cluster assembly protein SufD [Solirubrobacteraceae bacterium]